MTMMCLLNWIGPTYLFIHVSTMQVEKKSGSVTTGDVYLRSDMNGSEREVDLLGEWLVVPHAVGLGWNVLGLIQWLSMYGMVSVFSTPGAMCWLFSLGLMVYLSKSGEAVYSMHVSWAWIYAPQLCVSCYGPFMLCEIWTSRMSGFWQVCLWLWGGRSVCFWCVSCSVMYGLLHQIL